MRLRRAHRHPAATAFRPLAAGPVQHTPHSALEEFYRSIPWVLLVGLGILGRWSPEQIQAVVFCLAPVILLGAYRSQRG